MERTNTSQRAPMHEFSWHLFLSLLVDSKTKKSLSVVEPFSITTTTSTHDDGDVVVVDDERSVPIELQWQMTKAGVSLLREKLQGCLPRKEEDEDEEGEECITFNNNNKPRRDLGRRGHSVHTTTKAETTTDEETGEGSRSRISALRAILGELVELLQKQRSNTATFSGSSPDAVVSSFVTSASSGPASASSTAAASSAAASSAAGGASSNNGPTIWLIRQLQKTLIQLIVVDDLVCRRHLRSLLLASIR